MPSSISSHTSSSSYTSSSEASSLLVHPPSPKLLLNATQEAATSTLPRDPYSSTLATEQASLPPLPPLPPTPPPERSRMSSLLRRLPPPVTRGGEAIAEWRDRGPVSRLASFQRGDDNGEAQEGRGKMLEAEQQEEDEHHDEDETPHDDEQEALAGMLEFDDDGQEAPAEMLELAEEEEDGRDSVAEMAWSRAPDPGAIKKGNESNKEINIDSSPVRDD